MLINWIDIWDVQSGSRAKGLINWCFNIGRYIATTRGANMNPGVLQCKNCWKWGHTTFSYRIQGSKCVKCNRLHKSDNYHEFSWCCKANDKLNPPCLETKKGEPYLHFFKYSNCWGDYQADSNLCPFWKNRFNREWHQKKYVEIWKLDKINSFSHERWYTMIYNNLKIFSQNVWKNSLIINTILETQSHFDIIFIQGQFFIWFQAPLVVKKKVLVGTPYHSN